MSRCRPDGDAQDHAEAATVALIPEFDDAVCPRCERRTRQINSEGLAVCSRCRAGAGESDDEAMRSEE